MPDAQMYRLRILSLTLTTYVGGLDLEKTNFLFRVFDAIVDCLHKEEDIDKVHGGGGDISYQIKYMDDILERISENKTVANFIEALFSSLLQNVKEFDAKSLFGDYRKYLEETPNKQLQEYSSHSLSSTHNLCRNLVDFEKLVFIQGLPFFYELLKKQW